MPTATRNSADKIGNSADRSPRSKDEAGVVSTPEIEIVEGRRVLCGRCRHDVGQSRALGGAFDRPPDGEPGAPDFSPGGLTYHCAGCGATYAVCRACGWYMPDGCTCHTCTPDNTDRGDAMLPSFIQESLLTPDPAGRPGHWHYPPTGQVVSMPRDWRPKGADPAPGTEAAPAEDPRVGRRVEVMIGRYEHRRGQVTEVGADADNFGLRVLIDDEGTEFPLDGFEQVRLLTDEEVAADEKALKEKREQA